MTTLIERLVDSAKQSMETRNWYAALATVLMLPDVCAGLETDGQTTRKHYTDWCRRFLVPVFAEAPYNVDFPEKEFYLLRCAFLHQASGEVQNPKNDQYVDSYMFILPKKGWTFSTRLIRDRTLVIEVSTYCSAMIEAAERWIEDVAKMDSAIQKRDSSLLKFVDPGVDGIPL